MHLNSIILLIEHCGGLESSLTGYKACNSTLCTLAEDGSLSFLLSSSRAFATVEILNTFNKTSHEQKGEPLDIAMWTIAYLMGDDLMRQTSLCVHIDILASIGLF